MKYVASHVDAMDLVEDFLELGKEVPYLTSFDNFQNQYVSLIVLQHWLPCWKLSPDDFPNGCNRILVVHGVGTQNT